MWVIPVDLASQNDYTAVSAVWVAGTSPRTYTARHLERWRGLPYPETVSKIVGLANSPQLREAVLAVDATGVGKPVVDSLRVALPGRRIYAITITAGHRVNAGSGPRDVNVPKKDLIGAAQLLLQSRRLNWSRELLLMDKLTAELANFKMKITTAENVTYEAWREGDHDDLVLCLSMACWLGENLPGPLTGPIVYNAEPTPTEPPTSRMASLVADLPDLFGDDGSKF